MVPKKILIIDDERIIRYTTSVLLGKKGIATVSAETGQQGLELLASEKPDMVLLDINMPDIDGWSILERIRNDPQTAELPVVLFSASDYADTVHRAKQKKVNGVLRKPFQLEELLAVCDVPAK